MASMRGGFRCRRLRALQHCPNTRRTTVTCRGRFIDLNHQSSLINPQRALCSSRRGKARSCGSVRDATAIVFLSDHSGGLQSPALVPMRRPCRSGVSPTPGRNQGQGSNPRGCRGAKLPEGKRAIARSPPPVQPLRHFVRGRRTPSFDAPGLAVCRRAFTETTSRPLAGQLGIDPDRHI